MARTIEAFAVYHRTKESLSEYLQVASAGLHLLRRNIDVSNGSALLGSFVDACGVTHWGAGKHFKHPLEKVDAGLTSLADHGIIQQVAAFDTFTRSVIQDVSRFSARARNTFSPLSHEHKLLKLSSSGRWVSDHCCNDIAGRIDNTLAHRLSELQTHIGWSPSARLQHILPLFELIRRIRNRIVHADGTLSSELETIYDSDDTIRAFEDFQKNYTKGALPKMPVLERDRPLKFETVHAIMFGAILYEITKEIGAYAASLLDDDEYIDMAFYYSCIVDEHPFRTIRHRLPESRVTYFLSGRYWRATTSPGPEAVLKRLTAQSVQLPKAPKRDTTYWQIALDRHRSLAVGENAGA